MDGERRVDVLLGDSRRALLFMAMPILVSLLAAQANVLADRAWCSGLGVDPLAAVALVAPLYNVMAGLGSGLGVGASAVVSRMIGAGRREEASTCASQAVVFALAFGFASVPLVAVAQVPLLELIGAGEIVDLCSDYMLPYTLTIPLTIINGTVAGILNGEGSVRQSTAMMVAMAASNALLDPLFIYWAGMGIQGAAIATVASTAISLALGVRFLLSRGSYLNFPGNGFRLSPTHMRMVTAAGVPQMLEYCVLYGMDAVLNLLVVMCAGADGFAVFSTSDKVVESLFIPALAVGSALVPVASSAYGQRNPERMTEAFRRAMWMGIAPVAALVLLTEAFPEQIMTLFTYSGQMEAYRPDMAYALTVLCLYAPFFSINPLCSGYLQALARPGVAVACAILRNAVLITLFFIAGQHSLQAIFWSLLLGHLIGASMILSVTLAVRRKVFARMAGQEP